MKYVINKNFSILANCHDHEFFLFPYILLYSLFGVEITVGWGMFSVTLSYSSDNDNESMDYIRKEVHHD